MLFFYQNKDREMFLADLFILPVEAVGKAVLIALS
jgi:hypothetical protein